MACKGSRGPSLCRFSERGSGKAPQPCVENAKTQTTEIGAGVTPAKESCPITWEQTESRVRRVCALGTDLETSRGHEASLAPFHTI